MLYLLLLALFLINPFIAHPAYSQNPDDVSDNLRLEEFACTAKDPQSFKSCLYEAQTTGVPTIKIIAPINCTSRNDCTFEIKNLKSSLEISPLKPEFKITRSNDFGYTLLNIDASANIEFKDLIFEDQGQTGCPQGTTCPPLMTLKSSTNIIFNKVTLNATKGTSLTIADSRDISITDSIIKNSFQNGIEIKTNGFTQGLKIKGNIFENNSGTALIFQASSAGSSSSTITSNKFINNHSGGAFSSGCLYPCTGSQLKIKGPTLNLKVSENVITGGSNTAFDSLGLFASGIEVGGQSIANTILYCNEISGNRGSGIVQSPPFVNISGISIAENKLYNNGLNLNIPTTTPAEDNCYTQECKLSCMQN